MIWNILFVLFEKQAILKNIITLMVFLLKKNMHLLLSFIKFEIFNCYVFSLNFPAYFSNIETIKKTY